MKKPVPARDKRHPRPILASLLALMLGVLALAPVGPARAAGLEAFDFSDKVDEERFKHMIGRLRCLVCQNQSLADSDAELAHDLRQEVWEMMDQGRTDAEIVDFLVQRYGDFVLYEPPVRRDTWILWYGPFVMLGIGVLILAWTVRRRREQAATDTGLSDQEQARLKALLESDNENDSKETPS